MNFLISRARDLGLGDEEEVKKAAAVDMDWGRVADLAEAHGILPILCRVSSQVVPKFMGLHLACEYFNHGRLLLA